MISETPAIQDGSRIEVLADENLVEVYINDGEYVISNTVYGIRKTAGLRGKGTMQLYTLEK